ncbi:MAG: hypothetical protein GC154_15115 [bacterium]|nr:hypothetical protein [bacterium]
MLSTLIRRIHMYAGLFLIPWMLVYSLSTLVMNHRQWVASWYSTAQPSFQLVEEKDYGKQFSSDLDSDLRADAILGDLGMQGAHRVRSSRDNGELVIERFAPLGTMRITWRPDPGKIRIEREDMRASTILERLHRRRGYQHPYLKEDAYAFFVDAAIVMMMAWSLSGVWMWWDMKIGRKWGWISLGGGAALYAVFMVLM